MSTCLALLLLAAPQAEAAPPAGPSAPAAAPESAAPPRLHVGLSAGLGLAYDGLGVRLEVAGDQWAGYLGYGLLARGLAGTLTDSSGAGLSGGVRWYRGERRGLFLAANFTWARWFDFITYDGQYNHGPTAPGTLFTASALVGYRFRNGPAFLEVGLGGGFYRERDPFSCGDEPGYGCGQPAASWGPIPDLVLGVGFDL